MNVKYSDNRKVFNYHNDGNGDIPFLSFDMLDKLGVPNLYTTRFKSYDSKAGSGEQGVRVTCMRNDDAAEARPVVLAGLSELAEQLGTDIEHACVTRQEHTANVKLVKSEDLGLWYSMDRTEDIDGLVTDVPGACLMVYGADCPSVYIVDPVKKAIALVHAGWKGTLAKIPEAAINMMVKEYGCEPSDMYAAIGPSICENCYEMGDEIYVLFSQQWSREDADELMKRHESGKYHLDLWKANLMTMERSGIPRNHIEITNICTCCNPDTFYSYRAHRMENEQVAMLVNRISLLD